MCDKKGDNIVHDADHAQVCASYCNSLPRADVQMKVPISGVFMIDQVQPCPLPVHIQYLQLYGLQGLNFVKIPTDEKSDKFCMDTSVLNILKSCGVDVKFIRKLVDDYNSDPQEKTRASLLRLVELSREYAKFSNAAFLLDK